MKNAFLSFLLVCALCSIAVFAQAHGSGVSFEEFKDGYKVDIGHDEFIAQGEATRFDFALLPEDLSAVEGELFSDVWVTLTKDKKLFFAGGIDKPVFGATGFTYVFPEQGSYVVSARFQKEGETVVKSEFPLEVIAPLEEKKELNPMILYMLIGFAGLALGVATGLFIPRRTKNKV